MADMFNPTHPEGILKEELAYLKINVSDFAPQIEIDLVYLKSVLNEQLSITEKMAQKIALLITGPKADTWVAMQKDYDDACFYLGKIT